MPGSATNLAVFFVAFVILLVDMSKSATGFYDEGIVVYGAQRVADGDIPYKDFWTMYGPAQFWVVGGLFKVFGSSILVERIWDVFVRAIISLVAYLLVKRFTNHYVALFVWLLSVLCLSYSEFHGFPVFPSLLLVMASSAFFLDYVSQKKSRISLLYAGFFAGVAATFRHDLGFYVFASQMVIVLLYRKQIYESISDESGYAGRLWRDFLVLSTGAAIAGMPAVVYLLSVVPLENIIEQLFVFPATVYHEVRSLPYPSLLGIIKQSLSALQDGDLFGSIKSYPSILPFYFHFIVVLIGGLSIIHYAAGKNDIRRNVSVDLATAYLCVLVIVLFIKSLVRPEYIHLIHVIIPALVLGGIVSANYANRFRSIPSIVIVILMLGMAVEPVQGWSEKVTTYFSDLDCQSSCIKGAYWKLFADNHEISRADYFYLNEAQRDAIEFIQARTEPWERIYVGNVSHRKVFVNDILFYFLAERDSVTMYHELHPGQITTEAAQREVMKSLRHWKARYVVLLDKWENVEEPNDSSKLSSVDVLDKYLSNHYSEVAQFGSYSIRRIK